ncbi:uncharacterized protein LOC107042101 [Diachasma alloeum]|uniref:uncharacterized protein LOC107042101 n=1 Tax=Diachasma alloeum TaxID=454923 RepID=UPI000738441E|nr:uncharacterized protein LOC107042101 [Diachasma alloeum]
MGIVFEKKIGGSYKSEDSCRKVDSRRVPLTKLTSQNIKFLKSLGLKLRKKVPKCKNVGLTTLMKNYISQSPSQGFLMENAGWRIDKEKKITDDAGYFDVSIPLSMILGFAEDYQRIVVNAKHELILTRSHNDINAVIQGAPAAGQQAETFKISLTKIDWMIPYIKPADSQKVQLLNQISKDNLVPISFRAWELYEYPLLPRTSKHVYPYGNLNLDIAHNQSALLYDMYTSFQTSYYHKEPEPLFSRAEFLETAPLIVIDCSKQNEFLKSGPVDIRLEFESSADFPNNTAAYCLILHDRIIEYSLLSGSVKKLI